MILRLLPLVLHIILVPLPLGSNTELHDDIADPIKTLCGQTEISPILKYKDIKILSNTILF